MSVNNDQKIEKQLNGVHLRNITDEMKTSFLDYSMSVIVARALPDARDGLKPVHRRILYALQSLGMTYDKPYKKSARIVGEIIGKYHPHGDTAVYDTMVRMSQDFTYRYPLVDGHGNFGSIDGDGAAAMRYTESRMSKIAGELVKDLNKKIVPFVDNYDGSEKEPSFLPSYFPNLLVNGGSGIAVALATNMPPHNLTEVVNAICYAAKNPDCDVLALLDFIAGPDFPTGASILGQNGFKNAYLTGRGTVIIRSKTKFEKLNNNKYAIIIEEIPYQVKKTSLIENIVERIQNKKIQYITDLRDESNREGIRIVLELKNETYGNLVLNQLYKYTTLKSSFAINIVALENNQPKLLNLKQLITIYINHQIQMITNKAKYDLEKNQNQFHIISGLIIALDNIDQVIMLIKTSNIATEAIEKMNNQLNLSVEQAKAVLDMRLQRLTGLEKEKLLKELKELTTEIEKLQVLLSSEDNKINYLIDRLETIKNIYGDERKTEILEYEDEVIDESLINEEQIIITLSNKGYIKRVPLETYRIQNRGGVGIKATANISNDEDYVDHVLVGSTHSDLLFFSDRGKVYKIRAHKVPVYSRIAKGYPVINLIKTEKNEQIKTILNIKEYTVDNQLFFVTKKGKVKKTLLSEYSSIRNNGKIALKLNENDELIDVIMVSENAEIIIAASNGKAVRFNENQVRAMSRNAAGVNGMKLKNASVVGICTNNSAHTILSISVNGYGKMSLFNDYRLTKRASSGVISMKTNQKTGKLITIKSLPQEYQSGEILIITQKGIMIRISLASLRISGRNTSGVRLIKLKSHEDQIASVELINEESN